MTFCKNRLFAITVSMRCGMLVIDFVYSFSQLWVIVQDPDYLFQKNCLLQLDFRSRFTSSQIF